METGPSSEVRRAIWIFWCAFIATAVANRILLVDVLIASPSVVAIVGVKSLIYGALSLQMLRAASWARSGFTVLLGVDAADTLLDAWLLIGIPADVPHVPLLVGSEISFDAVYAYSVFLLYRDSSTAWFTGVQAQARKSPA